MENINTTFTINGKIITEYVEQLLKIKVDSIQLIKAIGNNRVFKVETVTKRVYIVKHYFAGVTAKPSRLQVEFKALIFLWKQGFRCIAKPYMCDAEVGIAVHEYIDGSPASELPVSADDIRFMVSFLQRLRIVSKVADANKLPRAAEACFSLEEVLSNINMRLEQFNQLDGDSVVHQELRCHIEKKITPMVDKMAKSARKRWHALGYLSHDLIDSAELTLSPSDFGFHNAIRCSNGKLKLIDLEYFGWDDPAKTISDFLLHPAMELTKEQEVQFHLNALAVFNSETLVRRFNIYFPLFSLKWMFICLNEFLPDGRKRRLFSGLDESNIESHLRSQLNKAMIFMNKADYLEENFPYDN